MNKFGLRSHTTSNLVGHGRAQLMPDYFSCGQSIPSTVLLLSRAIDFHHFGFLLGTGNGWGKGRGGKDDMEIMRRHHS